MVDIAMESVDRFKDTLGLNHNDASDRYTYLTSHIRLNIFSQSDKIEANAVQ
jgi:hypothetical protein